MPNLIRDSCGTLAKSYRLYMCACKLLCACVCVCVLLHTCITNVIWIIIRLYSFSTGTPFNIQKARHLKIIQKSSL